MDDNELVSILAQHEARAIGYQAADNGITDEQETALAYYMGIMEDVPHAEGTSGVKDGTVALVVDNAVSALLLPFVSSDETVRFNPRQPEDVQFAEQATEYVNYIINCDNPGFLILHNWFKDACLSKLGVVKIWWEGEERIEAQEHQIEDELQGAVIRSHPNYLGEENGIALIGETVPDGRCKIENIPPEEFRISADARDVATAEYTAHVPSNYTRSHLLEMGFDPEIIESLPAYNSTNDENTLRATRFAEETYADDRIDNPHKPNDRIAVRDEYVRIDYNGDGIAELRRIIRVQDTILLNDEVDENPFATLCPIPMPHKIYGYSIADRAVQEQKIGTVLWRQALDNLYKSNNPRPVIGEGAILPGGATHDTLNDNAPGAEIRVKDVTQLRYEAVPFTADNVFPMFELLDKKTEENTGISRAGQGLDTNALRKSGQMTATEMAMIAQGKNARTEMVARIFAETGVMRMFKLILKLVTKHQPRERIIRLRNQFVPVDPRGWPEMDVTISVGLGVGDKVEQMAQADSVLQTMAELAQTTYASLIDKTKVYNALKRKFTAAGIKNTDDYLIEPQEGEQQQEQPDPEAIKAQNEAALQAAKLQGEQQIAAAKLDMQAREQEQKQQLARAQAEFEAQLAREKAAFEIELAREKMRMEAELAREQAHMKAQADVEISKNRPGGDLAE